MLSHTSTVRKNAISDERVRYCALCTHSVAWPLFSGRWSLSVGERGGDSWQWIEASVGRITHASHAAQHAPGVNFKRHLWVGIRTTESCDTACVRRRLWETSVGGNQNYWVMRHSMDQASTSRDICGWESELLSHAAQHGSGVDYERHLWVGIKTTERCGTACVRCRLWETSSGKNRNCWTSKTARSGHLLRLRFAAPVP